MQIKPRHAAALALVGWYLMLPPWNQQKQPAVEAPIAQWQRVALYATVATCEKNRSRMAAGGGHWTDSNANTPNNADEVPNSKEQEQMRNLQKYAQCVSADDPRLKSR
jgi:hypothetical protein